MTTKTTNNSGNIFSVLYRPEKHDGVENVNNDVHNYVVEPEEQFQNSSRNEKCAGLTAKDILTGDFKRFRFDRIVAMNAIK